MDIRKKKHQVQRFNKNKKEEITGVSKTERHKKYSANEAEMPVF